MLSFANFYAVKSGHCLTFLHSRNRHLVCGVASGNVRVFFQDESMDDLIFAAHFGAGEFKFDVGHSRPFTILFEFDDGVLLSLKQMSEAHTLMPDAGDTWTSVEHRPAINPEMAAIQRQLRMLQMQVQSSYAARKPKPVMKATVSVAESQPIADVEKLVGLGDVQPAAEVAGEQ